MPTSSHAQLDVAALFEAYSAFAWRVLKRHGVAERHLEDACQEVFLVAHRRRDDFEGRSEVRTWLYGIALRVALNFRRKARRTRETESDELPEPVLAATQLEALEQKQLTALIEAALRDLPDNKREVFALYEIEGMTMAEVARTLRVPENTALYRLYGAREQVEQRPSSGGCGRRAAPSWQREVAVMVDPNTPQRWLDGAEAGLPTELLEGLRGCAAQGPSDVQRTRMQESLLRGVAGAAAGTAVGSVPLKLAGLAVVAGLTAGGFWWWQARPVPPAPAGVPAALAPNVAEPASEASAPVASEPGSAREAPRAAPSGRAKEAPAAAPSARAKAVPRTAKIPPHADAAGELELLKRARRALASTPERSLELASEHAHTFGEGSFGQERELLAVEALVKLQRLDEARRRAARFAARYPGSAHLPRLDVLVGPR